MAPSALLPVLALVVLASLAAASSDHCPFNCSLNGDCQVRTAEEKCADQEIYQKKNQSEGECVRVCV